MILSVHRNKSIGCDSVRERTELITGFHDRIDVLRFWGLVREQDRCFSDFCVCVGTEVYLDRKR